MDKTKCITFDPVAQEALPDHIKAKMKADRDKAKLEAYHKQCPCWNSHNDSCYDDNCPCDRDCEYMKSFNLKRNEDSNNHVPAGHARRMHTAESGNYK